MGLGTRLLHNMYYVTLFLEVLIAFSIGVRVSDVLPPPPLALIYQWMLNISSITNVPLCAFSCKIVWHFSFAHTRFCEGQGSMWVEFSCYTSDNIWTIMEKIWSVYCIYNFQERKFSQISWFCGYLWKFSLWNFGAWHPLGGRQKRAILKSFLRENCIFHQFAKVFSPESFLLYSTCTNLNI